MRRPIHIRMNATDHSSVVPLGGQSLRILALLIQSVVAACVLALGALGVFGPLRDWAYAWLGLGAHQTSPTHIALVCLVWALLAILTFAAAWRLQARSWWRIAIGFAAVGASLAYLAHDEPTFRHPVTEEEISPSFPGAEASYAALMQYGKNHALGKTFRAPSFEAPYPQLNPDQPVQWQDAITRHRTEIAGHWAALANERAWWVQVSEFDRIADLMPARFDGEILSFQVFRTVSQHSLAMASLEALDGHGDEAVDILLPTLKVGLKLQPYSRTLVRAMIGCVVERISLGAAAFILDHAAVSPSARERLVAALPGEDPEKGARHLFATEYVLDLGAMGSARVGDIMAAEGQIPDRPWLRACLNFVSPFLYNPRATLNRMGDLYADWEELAAHRNLDRLDARWQDFYREQSRPSLKNVYGRWLTLEVIPAYQKVSENYWRMQDQRAALLKRLTAL